MLLHRKIEIENPIVLIDSNKTFRKKIAPLILLSFLCRVFYVERLFKRAYEQERKKERYNVNIQRL